MKQLLAAFLFLLLAAGGAAAQTSYPLYPFQCPTGQFVYGFNPVTGGNPGWFCATPAGGGGGGTGNVTAQGAFNSGDLPVVNNSTGTIIVDSGFSLPLTVAGGGTGQTALTANTPLFGNGAAGLITGTKSGSTFEVATVAGSTMGGCSQFNINGDLFDTGQPCNFASPGGAASQVQYNALGLFAGTAGLTVSPTAITSMVMGLGGDTIGDTYFNNGASVSNLPIGTNGYFYSVCASIPCWVPAPGGGNVSTSGAITIGKLPVWATSNALSGTLGLVTVATANSVPETNSNGQLDFSFIPPLTPILQATSINLTNSTTQNLYIPNAASLTFTLTSSTTSPQQLAYNGTNTYTVVAGSGTIYGTCGSGATLSALSIDTNFYWDGTNWNCIASGAVGGNMVASGSFTVGDLLQAANVSGTSVTDSTIPVAAVAQLSKTQTFSSGFTNTFAGTLNVTGTFQIGGTSVSLPLSVGNGGTGASSFTSNALIKGGTTLAISTVTDAGGGVQIGSPTGGAEGAGTLNAAGGIYSAGNLLINTTGNMTNGQLAVASGATSLGSSHVFGTTGNNTILETGAGGTVACTTVPIDASTINCSGGVLVASAGNIAASTTNFLSYYTGTQSIGGEQTFTLAQTGTPARAAMTMATERFFGGI